MHIAAVVAGCINTLVSTGGTSPFLSCTKLSSPFAVYVGAAFWHCKQLLLWIERLLVESFDYWTIANKQVWLESQMYWTYCWDQIKKARLQQKLKRYVQVTHKLKEKLIQQLLV